jgi:GNAT superfamily N-acetyltransferase
LRGLRLNTGSCELVTETYSIVAAARQHLSAVPKLEQAAATMFPEEDLPAALRYLVTDRNTLREAQRDGRLWMAVDAERRPVGFALAVVLDGEAFLDEVDVHPRHVRRGIGTRLVNTVIGWAESCDFSSLSLITFRHLPWNAPFYERFGFAPLARHEFGPAMSQILEEEAQAGINVANRIGMRRMLRTDER